MTSNSLEGLVVQVKQHRLANGIPLEQGWIDELYDTLCQNPHVGARNCGDAETLPKPERNIGLDDVLRFVRTINEWLWKEKFKLVSSELAHRRAVTCSQCPANIEVHGCLGCKGVTRRVAEMLLEDRIGIGDDYGLKSCGVCGCYLPLKIHVPLAIALSSQPAMEDEWPANCWMVTEDVDSENGTSNPS